MRVGLVLDEADIVHQSDLGNAAIRSKGPRRIAHKFMNDYVLRVVYEEDGVITVVTVYPSRRERYGETV